MDSSAVPPIAEDALSSLFLVYFTVLALCAFLWLYLKCGRDELGCVTLYTVERNKLGSQVQLAFACLLVKQLILGVYFSILSQLAAVTQKQQFLLMVQGATVDGSFCLPESISAWVSRSR